MEKRLRNSANEDARSIMDSIRYVVRAIRIASRASEKARGLTAAQFFVLQNLDVSEGPISINMLAERTFTHQSSVSVVVTKLVERGLVSRNPSREDARRMEVSLTEDGREALKSAPKPMQEHLIGGLMKMSDDDRHRLAELLREMVGLAGFDAGVAPPFEEDQDLPKPKGRVKKRVGASSVDSGA